MKSTLLQDQEFMLKFYEKFKDNSRIEYQKWFIDNSKLYTKVNKELSNKVSKQIDAQVKQCYYNCFKALHINGLEYCEGFVLGDKRLPIPIDHSWLVNKKGEVIDPTLEITGKRLQKQMKKYADRSLEERNRYGVEYYGIKYTKKQVTKFALKTKITGSYLHLLYQEENK